MRHDRMFARLRIASLFRVAEGVITAATAAGDRSSSTKLSSSSTTLSRCTKANPLTMSHFRAKSSAAFRLSAPHQETAGRDAADHLGDRFC
jgi:hypothetical protein